MARGMRAVEVVLSEAGTAADFAAARRLFQEYAHQLPIDLGFQGFEAELERLPDRYSPPGGCLLIGRCGGDGVACGGVRGLGPQDCEMKRLYVRPETRGSGLGRRIAQALVGRARELGYAHVYLDTLESMAAARAIYRSLGFRETAPYYLNPFPGVIYMELDL